ncbi:unnamed protein product [Orchesella dallaii]|uniref:Uncharacterized protein n=1 Tax=Orchesella dallaii TaxID=48710 RepID=A0ABP1QGY6_9HEXA
MCYTTLQLIAILASGRTISTCKDGFSWLVPLLGCILTCGGLVWSCSLILCPRNDASKSRHKDSKYCMNANTSPSNTEDMSSES